MSRWQAGAGNRPATPANDDPGGVSWLYVIANAANHAGACKVGLSNDPARRLKQFQTASAMPLKIWHTEAVPAGDVRRWNKRFTGNSAGTGCPESGLWFWSRSPWRKSLAIIHHADDPSRRGGWSASP